MKSDKVFRERENERKENGETNEWMDGCGGGGGLAVGGGEETVTSDSGCVISTLTRPLPPHTHLSMTSYSECVVLLVLLMPLTHGLLIVTSVYCFDQ